MDDLNNKIISDLASSGFGSEMQSLKLFLDANWSADGNEIFFDKDEAKSREYDLSAFRSLDLESDGKLAAVTYIFLTGEVKKSNTPWIVFRHNPRYSFDAVDDGGSLLYASNLPKPLFHFHEAISNYSIVEQRGWWGKGIHEAFKDPNKKSRWYSAFITACKAGEHAMWREASAEDPRGSISDNLLEKATYFLLVRPVVILDGKLFSAQLDEDAKIQVEEITEASLSFGFRAEKYEIGRYTVDLVTLDSLSDYIQMWDKRHHCIIEELARQSGLSNCKIKK